MPGPPGTARPPLPAELERLLHDLRGPLNSAVMHVEVLKRLVGDDPAAAQSLATIQQQLDRLAAMLPAAAGVLAIEPGHFQPVGLRALVERVLCEQGLADVMLATGPWPEVFGDPALLTQAIVHLVGNALEATAAAGEPRPRPELRVLDDAPDGAADGRRKGLVTLVVRDWGAGFKNRNPRALIRLLGSQKPGHSGVGLLIVERIARLHGGALRLEPLPDGAAAYLTLPLA
jgi:signal transduction histidine kinase